ncbi:MAG: GNAT family N-acetyltransferase [Clostridiales bacterium]|jgi:ribosomal protein S18 acetylase RimI-like enzyme|nr:GNAT family N-acetyltransferase [Clostridiales bacterium]
MITIREYRPTDKEKLQNICIATGPAIKNKKHRLSQLALYCDYFVDCEPKNVFVAANEKDEAVGYILCCTDFLKYKSEMNSRYLKTVGRFSLVKKLLYKGEIALQKSVFKDYGAFLHIDILDGYRRMGVGTRLMDTLLAHLKAIGVKGVTLGVGSENTKGVSFYQKYGFHTVKKGTGFYIFGMFTSR